MNQKLKKIGLNSLRGFLSPVFNFLITTIGISQFGKENWGSLIHVFLWIFLISFVINWGNRDFLIRKYSANPAKIETSFFSNFFSRSLLLVIAAVFFFFFPLPVAIVSITLVFLMHSYNSLESLIVYQQKFEIQLWAETIGFLSIILGLFYFQIFTVTTFISMYCIAFVLKIILVLTRIDWRKKAFKITFSIDEFKESMLFFLLGLTGLLSSRIDLYIVNSIVSNKIISEYQLLTSAFLMLQSASSLIITTINKQLYRLRETTFEKVKNILHKLALPIVAVGSFGIWVLLEKFVNLGVDWKVYFVAGLAAIPSFFYALPVMNLYKKKCEKKVLFANLITIGCNILITVLLLAKFGIQGAIASACISQWIYLFIIKQNENKISK